METQTETNQTTETQAQATDPCKNWEEMTIGAVNRILYVLMEEVNKMVDSRVERIMATQAQAALFNDQLDERIRTIAMEEAQEKIDDMPDMEDVVHDKVAEAIENIDLDDSIERAFKHSINWEEAVEEHVDSLIDDKLDDAVDSALDNMLADKIDEILEERMREVLIKIIKGE